jgi:thiol-disulfide isomerase/thioredoxin
MIYLRALKINPMKSTLILFILFGLMQSCSAPQDKNRVKIMDQDELVDYLKKKSGKSFFAADWCGGCDLTFTNVVLPILEEYNYEIIYFGSEQKLDAYLNQHDSLQIIRVDLLLNNPLSHKSNAAEILTKLDNNYEYQWQFPIEFIYNEGRIKPL